MNWDESCLLMETKMAKGKRNVANGEQQNSHDDLNHYVVDALKDIFNNEEQTYDDLLKGFMFFKKENILPVHDSTANVNEGLSGTSSKSFKVAKPPKSPVKSRGKMPHIEDSGNISEEELGPETCTGSMLERAMEGTGGRSVQLDNYVEDEGELSCLGESDDQSDKINFSPTLQVNENGPGSTGNYNSVITADTTDALVLMLPGEVDPSESDCNYQGADNSQQGKPNQRCLQFTATAVRDRTDNQAKGDGDESGAQSENCQVTEFTLDENFDYDNVPFTRKFEFLGNTKR